MASDGRPVPPAEPQSLLCSRYAFSPLLDEESEEEEDKEPMMNEAFGGLTSLAVLTLCRLQGPVGQVLEGVRLTERFAFRFHCHTDLLIHGHCDVHYHRASSIVMTIDSADCHSRQQNRE